VTIHLITGSDPRLVSDKVSDITRELIKSMSTDENRSTILETHDAGAASGQEREDAIRLQSRRPKLCRFLAKNESL